MEGDRVVGDKLEHLAVTRHEVVRQAAALCTDAEGRITLQCSTCPSMGEWGGYKVKMTLPVTSLFLKGYE